MSSIFSRSPMRRPRRTFVLLVILVVCAVRQLLYRLLLSDNPVELKRTKVLQATQFVGKGVISITGASLGVWPSPRLLSSASYIEARSAGASVIISEGTQINNGATIIADRTSVRIGKRCLIGGGLFVCDSDFHGLDIENRRNGVYECAPVLIGDDVFIGENVSILKGVTVGNGAVIGSGAVVVADVEGDSVFAGVPARKIKLLKC